MDEVQRLFEDYGTVDELEIDLAFQEHLAQRATYDKHRVTIGEILGVHQNQPGYFLNQSSNLENPEQRRAPLILVGPTPAGRFLAVPLEPTNSFGTWRVVTAFAANTHHIDKWNDIV